MSFVVIIDIDDFYLRRFLGYFPCPLITPDNWTYKIVLSYMYSNRQPVSTLNLLRSKFLMELKANNNRVNLYLVREICVIPNVLKFIASDERQYIS